MRHDRLMDPGSGSLELPRDGSAPAPPAPAPTPAHHVVVAPVDRDLLGDPSAGSSPTLIRDPVDLEERDATADLGSSPTLIRDPVDVERPEPEPSAWRAWLPFLMAALILGALVFVCG